MKKAIALLLTVITLMLISACGKDGSQAETCKASSSSSFFQTSSPTEFLSTVAYQTASQTEAESELCSVPLYGTNAEFQAIRTSYTYNNPDGYPDFPYVVVIESKQELEKYIADNEKRFDLSHKDKVYSDTTIGFVDAIAEYDDEFFSNHSLIMTIDSQPSGSIRYRDADLMCSEGAKLLDTVLLTEFHPYVGTCDMAHWHIIIEALKDSFEKDLKIEIKEIREPERW